MVSTTPSSGGSPSSGVRFGLALPQVFTESPIDMRTVRLAAQRADSSRCHSLWTQSQLVGRADVLEPLTLLSYVAALTTRVRLATSVLVATEHNPVQLAKLLSSLDRLSSGRVIVGLGLGAPGVTLRMGGHGTDRRGQRLMETLGIITSLWGDDAADFDGDIWQFRELAMNPKPLQRPHPPIMLGGHHPNSFRRAALYADGWLGAGASSLSKFADDVAGVRQALEENGRDEDGFTIAKRIYVAFDDDRSLAERRLTERFAAYTGTPERATAASIYGSPDDVAEGVQQVIDIGASMVILNPVYDFLDQQSAALELIGGNLA